MPRKDRVQLVIDDDISPMTVTGMYIGALLSKVDVYGTAHWSAISMPAVAEVNSSASVFDVLYCCCIFCRWLEKKMDDPPSFLWIGKAAAAALEEITMTTPIDKEDEMDERTVDDCSVWPLSSGSSSERPCSRSACLRIWRAAAIPGVNRRCRR